MGNILDGKKSSFTNLKIKDNTMPVHKLKSFSGTDVQVGAGDKKMNAFARKINTDLEHKRRLGGQTLRVSIRIGQNCAKFRDYIKGLNEPGLHEVRLFELTGLSKASVSKYIAIATSPVIRNEKNHTKLPSSMFSLYEIATMDPRRAQAAIDEGTIKPEMDRSSLAETVGAGTDKVKSPATNGEVDVFTISLPAETWRKAYDKFERDLHELLETYHAELKYGKTVQVIKSDELKQLAEQQFEQRFSKIPEQERKLANLVDNAIVECNKNGVAVTNTVGKTEMQLSPDWEWAGDVRAKLGINGPIYLSTIHRQARAKKLVCKQMPLGEIDEEMDLWLAMRNICNNHQKVALKKKLQKIVLTKDNATSRIRGVAKQIYAMVRYL